MGGNEFEIKFSEQTIERLAHNFQKKVTKTIQV